MRLLPYADLSSLHPTIITFNEALQFQFPSHHPPPLLILLSTNPVATGHYNDLIETQPKKTGLSFQSNMFQNPLCIIYKRLGSTQLRFLRYYTVHLGLFLRRSSRYLGLTGVFSLKISRF